MRSLILVGTMLMVGCAPTPVVFVKDGAQPGDFENAKYDCKVQGDQSAMAIAYARDPLSNLSYLSQARQDMIDCLTRRG